MVHGVNREHTGRGGRLGVVGGALEVTTELANPTTNDGGYLLESSLTPEGGTTGGDVVTGGPVATGKVGEAVMAAGAGEGTAAPVLALWAAGHGLHEHQRSTKRRWKTYTATKRQPELPGWRPSRPVEQRRSQW